jgi:uncharacterized OB-fold protein
MASRLWIETENGPKLVGGSCSACGARRFPFVDVCSICRAGSMEAVPLANEGVLYAFTSVHVLPKGFVAPHVVGFVDLDDGIRVFAKVECDPASTQIGARVHLALGSRGLDATGKSVLTYVFRPL